MREAAKPTISLITPPYHNRAVPLERWLDAPTSVPEGQDFLEGILEHGAIFAPDLTQLRRLGGLLPMLEQWACGLDIRLEADGWLKYGPYRLLLSKTGTSLTVRKGNKYGRFIDTGDVAPESWEAVVNGFKSAGLTEMPYPTSCGSVAAGLLNQMAKVSVAGIPAPALRLAWQACKGGRMEALTLGTFNGYAADISSAYPAAARDLPHTCHWYEKAAYQPGADFGVALIDVTLPQWKAGPLAVRMEGGELPEDDLQLAFPAGKFESVAVALPDMKLLAELGIPFKVRTGWWGAAPSAERPLQRVMDFLWGLRDVDEGWAKAVAVACVGQLGSLQEDLSPRPFFHPVYWSHIYAMVRGEIFRKAASVGLENVHAFRIDGIATAKRPPVDVVAGMGRWRFDGEGEFFLTGDYFKDKPDTSRWRDAVQSTPAEIAQDSYSATFDRYVSLALAWQENLGSKLGEYSPVTEILPLGTKHRQIPAGLERQTYLTQAIPTEILSVD